MNRVSYRQLQSFAKRLNLPGNMKYQVMWDMVSARKAGNERRVEQLMNEQKRLRFKRRLNRKVVQTLEEDNLRLAQLSSDPYSNDNSSSRPILMDDSTHREIVIDSSGQREVGQNSGPPHVEWDYARDLKMVHLLDAKVRHDVMDREIREFRNLVQQLPVHTPKESLYSQYPHYQFSPVTPASTLCVPNVEPIVPLSHSGVIHGNPHGPIMSPMFFGSSYKRTESSAQEIKSYHIEDLIGPVPSTSYVPECEYHMPVPMPQAQFTRCGRVFDHEGYQQKYSAPPIEQQIRSQKNDVYNTSHYDASLSSDTQSADELGVEMEFEDEQYDVGFEPYIEEVISSQPFEPDQGAADLPPSRIFKSEQTAGEEDSEDPNQKIIIEIGKETSTQSVNHMLVVKVEHDDISKEERVDLTKEEHVDSTNQVEERREEAQKGVPEESDAPAIPTSSKPSAGVEPPETDLAADKNATSEEPSSPGDGELKIVLPEDMDEAPTEDCKADLLIKEPPSSA